MLPWILDEVVDFAELFIVIHAQLVCLGAKHRPESSCSTGEVRIQSVEILAPYELSEMTCIGRSREDRFQAASLKIFGQL